MRMRCSAARTFDLGLYARFASTYREWGRASTWIDEEPGAAKQFRNVRGTA